MVESKSHFKDFFIKSKARENGEASRYRLKTVKHDIKGQPQIAFMDGEWSMNQARRFVKQCIRLGVSLPQQKIDPKTRRI